MAASAPTSDSPLPLGERIELAGRGTTFVRQVPGPPGAPTVVLLHGWFASGGLNWFNAFEPLSERYTVVAPDLRGHGRGIRARGRFRLADCADDVAALLEHVGTGPVIAVGYSMGGPVAQLLWRRHRQLVAGLVLCATSSRFVGGTRDRLFFGSLMATAAGTTRAGRLLGRVPLPSIPRLVPRGTTRPTDLRAWAAGELRRHDLVTLLEAGQAIGSFSARRWVGEIDVPTTVMVTERDRAIDAAEQRGLAAAIPGATVQEVDDGHLACARDTFGPALVRAVDSVAARVAAPARRAS